MRTSLGRWVLLFLILAFSLASGMTPVVAATLPFTRNLCAPGNHFLSLPSRTDLKKAEDLCSLIPNATTVAQQFPDGAGSWVWTCGSTTSAGCSPNTPEPGTCGSLCFCIDRGEGYVVTVTAPSTFDVYGCEEPDTITLKPPVVQGSRHIISVPYDTALGTWADLAGYIGLNSTGGALVPKGLVTGIDGCTQVFQTCTAGTQLCSQLPIVPGEAYRIAQGLPPSPSSYVNPTTGVNACPQVTLASNKYCITGTSSGTDYSWGYELIGAVNFTDTGETWIPSVSSQVGLVPAGGSATDLASNLVSSIQAALAACGAPCSNISVLQFGGANSHCFWIKKSGPPPQPALWVGPVFGSVPADYCEVTSIGCTYNPTIVKVDVLSVPALGSWGMIALVVLLSLAAVYLLRRRLRLKSGLEV